MRAVSVWLVGGVLSALSLFHLYWAAGGRHGVSVAIPSTEGGQTLFQPGTAACLAEHNSRGVAMAVLSYC